VTEITYLSIDEIIAINKKFNGGTKIGDLDFILSKIESYRLTENFRKDVAESAATLWYYIIQNHVFVDGNKRTAAESVKLFCKANEFCLDIQSNGFIYISLRIANNHISFQELVDLIYEKLRK
jgi:death-on-curing protein